MIALQREIETLLLIVLITGFSLFVIAEHNNKTPQHIFTPVLPSFVNITPTPTPQLLPHLTVSESPDGTKTLTMEEKQIDANTTYSFSITGTDTQQKSIYSITVDSSHSFSIPYNTFSSDNAYFFLKESIATQSSYLVFSSSGFPFGSNSFINVSSRFVQNEPDYMISDITGWAGPTLLIINAKNKDRQLSSFWYDVASESFIPLANVFY